MDEENSVIAALKRALVYGALAAAFTGTFVGMFIGYPCVSTGLAYGLWLDECPATDLRLEVEVSATGLVRGQEGRIVVAPFAVWLDGEGADPRVGRRGLHRGAEVSVALVDAEGERVDGLAVGEESWVARRIRVPLTLPPLPDGTYRLQVEVRAGFDETRVELELPLYVPAVAHLSADRPLFRPGQEVHLRSVLLARTDLRPLGGRPGRWRVTDPAGEVMHLERARADEMGIADMTLPLDDRATIGRWTATFESGAASDQIHFEVRPFRLPRMVVDSAPSAPWFGPGEPIAVEGTVRYSSGAPVGMAPVQLSLERVEGRWPLPLEWEHELKSETAADGTFRVDLGRVPGDLIERAVLVARLGATDATGEVVQGETRLVLSQDPLRVEAVTELADGLVGGFNNRAWLRVMTPDGRPLPGVEVEVHSPWDPSAPVRKARADEDAVAALQLDPGAPVTVVRPAIPHRPRPFSPDPPRLVRGKEEAQDRDLSLAERRAIDAVLPSLGRCGLYEVGGAVAGVSVAVQPSGQVRQSMPNRDQAVDRCVAEAFRGLRMPPGALRTYTFEIEIPDRLHPYLEVRAHSAIGSAHLAEEALTAAAREGRRCLDRGQGTHGQQALRIHWAFQEGRDDLQVHVHTEENTGLSAQALACLRQHLQRARLEQAPDQDSMGVATATLSVPSEPGSAPPRATTSTGYELKVVATADGEVLGETRLVLREGQIPPLRLRATPSIAHPGQEVKIELFRGPGFTGELPKTLALRHGQRHIAREPMEGNAVTFVIPEDAGGFLHVSHGEGRAVILVQPREPLSLALSTDQPTYRPGEVAHLTVKTHRGDAPTSAAVGLSGVDQTLGQLAPLLGPDDWGRVTVRARADRPAFGMDPRALALGQVRGENAAQAAVLRISHLPADYGGDVAYHAREFARVDTEGPRADAFYRVLERLVPRVRQWERSAPAEAQMEPGTMVSLWAETLRELRAAGEPALDAFGRELTLDRLPPALVALVDPRSLVAEGTRLPEDMIDWNRYIAEEVAR